MSSSSRRSSIGSSVNSSIFRRRSAHNRTGDSMIDNQDQDGEGDGIVKIPIIGYEVMEERARFTVKVIQVLILKPNSKRKLLNKCFSTSGFQIKSGE